MGKVEDMFLHQKSDTLLKKAKELSELGDSDVGVILFSPNGTGVREFASGEGLEDVYLKLLDKSPEMKGQIKNRENIIKSLQKLKKERQLMNKVTKIQELWEEAVNVNHIHQAMRKRLSLYNPNINNLQSLEQIHESEHLIAQAIGKIHEIRNKKLAENRVKVEKDEPFDMKIGETSQEHTSPHENKRRTIIKNEQDDQTEKFEQIPSNVPEKERH